MGMEATAERNALYADAAGILTRALAAFAACRAADPADSVLEAEMLACQVARGAVLKYKTPF